ncbi:HNH endonuclease [Gemmatimonadota bacterium]
MNAYLAATDFDWFEFLTAQPDMDEVNFWMPKPWGGRFGVLRDGQPLLFKLKSPHNAIAGGGFFKHYTELPLSIAWETFEQRNGAETHLDVWRRITRLRRESPRPGDDPVIGCILLAEPFFWPPELWIRAFPGWHRSIQRGRTYDLQSGDGSRIWQMVMERLSASVRSSNRVKEPIQQASDLSIQGGFGDPFLQPRRLGQGMFRAVITDVYQRRCAVTQEKALPALEAAHIRPFKDVAEHTISNGILLRSDVHRLFDAGYITITPEYQVEASRRMKDDFHDGDTYLRLNGTHIFVPEPVALRPDPAALQWHNEERFRG